MAGRLKQKHDAFVNEMRRPFLNMGRENLQERRRKRQTGTYGEIDGKLMEELDQAYEKLFGKK